MKTLSPVVNLDILQGLSIKGYNIGGGGALVVSVFLFLKLICFVVAMSDLVHNALIRFYSKQFFGKGSN